MNNENDTFIVLRDCNGKCLRMFLPQQKAEALHAFLAGMDIAIWIDPDEDLDDEVLRALCMPAVYDELNSKDRAECIRKMQIKDGYDEVECVHK